MIDQTFIAQCSLSNLTSKITIYRAKNNEEPYLFMNYATAIAAEKVSEGRLVQRKLYDNHSNGYFGTYRSNKVYIDDDLPFGVVKIR